MDFLTVENLSKTYENGTVNALSGVSFSVAKGEVVAFMGPSGCGKSTLLGILGSLERPSRGRVLLEGRNIFDIRPLHAFRARSVGFVFQFHHLVPAMTLLENVEAPLLPLGNPRKARSERATNLLCETGLGHRLRFLPAHVSGGERQRAAVARALANDPPLVLADEPTGNLDSAAGSCVMDLLLRCARSRGATVLIATHNPAVAGRADRVLRLKDGVLES